MKNSELLTTMRQSLSTLERQRQYILRSLVQKNACPNCGHPQDFFESAGMDIDDWHGSVDDAPCKCTMCNRQLRYAVPFHATSGKGGWYWHLVPVTSKE